MANLLIGSFKSKFTNSEKELLTDGLSYSDRYLRHTLFHLSYYCSIYYRLFRIIEEKSKKPARELGLLDFGAGNGLLGLFAVHYGFGKVWIQERDPSFLQKAKLLSETTGLLIDGFIEGDESYLPGYFKNAQCRPDIIVGADVIEHIYNLDSFFKTVKELNPGILQVFTTGSNPYNYIKVRRLRKYQYQDEYVGHPADSSLDEVHNAEEVLSFTEQRKIIIAKEFDGIDEKTMERLVSVTRGKSKKDIVIEVQQFKLTGEWPLEHTNPYWVCDPETGSWTERVLAEREYRAVLHGHGFSLEMQNGFYNVYSGKWLKRFFSGIFNLICGLPLIGKYVSPFIILIGEKHPK